MITNRKKQSLSILLPAVILPALFPVSILLSTHNPQHALSFSDHILALFGGKVAAFGNTKETLTETLIETLYRMQAEFPDTEHGSVILPLTGVRT